MKISEQEAALILGLSLATIRRDRSKNSRGLGIPFFKIGAKVLYDPAALVDWLEQQRRCGPVQHAPQPQQPKRGSGRPRKLQGNDHEK